MRIFTSVYYTEDHDVVARFIEKKRRRKSVINVPQETMTNKSRDKRIWKNRTEQCFEGEGSQMVQYLEKCSHNTWSGKRKTFAKSLPISNNLLKESSLILMMGIILEKQTAS